MRPVVASPGEWARFLLGFALLCGVLLGLSALDATGRWGLGILAAVLVVAVAIEVAGDRAPLGVILVRIGLGRPRGRSLLLAAVVSALVLLVYPVTTALTGEPTPLRPGWPWLLIGVFAFHGLAEELVWRGYAFRRLRAGRSFAAATAWTMPLIALTHVPILVNQGVIVGLGALLVAAVTSVPFAYLYETGRETVWAPALVHTAIDSFKVVAVPAAALATFSIAIIVVSLVVPLLGSRGPPARPRAVRGPGETGMTAEIGPTRPPTGPAPGTAGCV